MYHLFFSNSISHQGFTNLSSSFTNDKNGSYIIRELLQNSLDATIEEAKRDKAVVKFFFEKIFVDEIPGIEDYKKAIKYIEQSFKLSEQEQDILNTIKEELNKEKIDVMYVVDNGIGFDKKRLIAVLSDGISEKSDPNNASGSYGNGHFSTFSSSNLRYVLYYGLNNGKKIFSGEAMLRSFIENGNLKSANGYLLKENRALLEENDIFIEENIPSFVESKLSSDGSVVCSLGFNFFDDKEKFIDIILATIVRNFFISILKEELVVEIYYLDKKYSLSKENLEDIFNNTSNISVFPGFNEVNKFFESYINGKKDIVNTSEGEVEICYKQSDALKIGLCRNGMWITSSMPSPLNKGSFTDFKPYNILILPHKNTEFARLIRRAEGNLHKDIKYNRFSDDKIGKNKRKRLNNALKEIREYLYGKLEKFESEEININIPKLHIPIVEKSSGNVSTKRFSNKTKKVKENIYTNAPAQKIEIKHKNKKSKNKLYLNKSIEFSKFWAKHNPKQKTAKLIFYSDIDKEIGLVLKVDTGKDITCDGFGVTNNEKIKINKAVKNNKKCEIIQGNIINLGKIKKDEKIELNIEYKFDFNDDYIINYEFRDIVREKDE